MSTHNPWQGPERRKLSRSNISLIVSYRCQQDDPQAHVQGYGLMLDINQKGMGMLATAPIAVSTKLLIQCSLIDANNPHHVKRIDMEDITGEVVNTTCLQQDKHRIGVRFIDIKKNDKRILDDFLKKRAT